MISRRIIRTKAMQSMYSLRKSTDKSLDNAEKELFYSIKKSYDLFHLLLLLPIEFRKEAVRIADANKKKHMPTEHDLNPNTKFIDNQLIAKLMENESLHAYVETNKLSWDDEDVLVLKLYKEFTSSEMFKEYMESEDRLLKEDRRFFERFYTEFILESEDFEQYLEESSIYWNDDLDYVISILIRVIGKIKVSTLSTKPLPAMFKDDEDRLYAKKLFSKAVLERENHQSIIEKHLKGWDMDRVAFIDMVIIELAITEFIYFPSIPVRVTLNEYIDMSKYYSTPQSKLFINGILDKIVTDLKAEGLVVKAGRGLVGEEEKK